MGSYHSRHYTKTTKVGLKSDDMLIAGHGKHNNVFGGPGQDTLVAAGAHDVLHGGKGADVYAFGMSDKYTKRAVKQKKPHTHTILNFNPSEGDKIDLSHLVDDIKDLNFIGTKDFSGKGGEIRVEMPASRSSTKRFRRLENSIYQTNNNEPLQFFGGIKGGMFSSFKKPRFPPIPRFTPPKISLPKFVPPVSRPIAPLPIAPIIHIDPVKPSIPTPSITKDEKTPVVDLIPDDLPLVDIIGEKLPVADLIPEDLPIVDLIPKDLPVGDSIPEDLPIADLLPDDLPGADLISDNIKKIAAPLSIKLSGLTEIPKISDLGESFTAMGKNILSGSLKDGAGIFKKGLGTLSDGLNQIGNLTGANAALDTIKMVFGDSNFGEVMSSLVSRTINGIPIPGSDSYIKFTPFMNIEPSVTNIRVPLIPPIGKDEISMDDMGADIDLDLNIGFDYDLTIGKQTGEFNLPSASLTIASKDIGETGMSRFTAGLESGYSPKFIIGEEATNQKVGFSTGIEGNISTSISNKSTIDASGRPYTIIKDNITGLGLDNVFNAKVKVGFDIGPKLPGSEVYLPPEGCKALIASAGIELGAEFGVAINVGSPNTLTAESKITPYGDIGSVACEKFSVTAIPLEFQTPIYQLAEKQSMII